MQLLYLHGFNSSPRSHKAQLTRQWLERTHPQASFVCPLISPYPDEAMASLQRLAVDIEWPGALVVGSSMGGFYATWMSQTYDCPGVLINPAVRPWRGRDYLLGEQRNFHTGERYLFEAHHIEAFTHWDVDPLPAPEKLRVLLQTGDEVLDYRQAENKYRQCRVTVEQGGDHAFQGLERYFDDIDQFWRQQQQANL
ncbi:MAG: esterase YqiA [Porticoccaceae bacterium]|nr:esterase YqiA [Porticoccaceae bacterium]